MATILELLSEIKRLREPSPLQRALITGSGILKSLAGADVEPAIKMLHPPIGDLEKSVASMFIAEQLKRQFETPEERRARELAVEREEEELKRLKRMPTPLTPEEFVEFVEPQAQRFKELGILPQLTPEGGISFSSVSPLEKERLELEKERIREQLRLAEEKLGLSKEKLKLQKERVKKELELNEKRLKLAEQELINAIKRGESEDLLAQKRLDLEAKRLEVMKSRQDLERLELAGRLTPAEKKGFLRSIPTTIEDVLSTYQQLFGQPLEFNSVEEAEKANLPVGTEIIINGRKAIVTK